MSAEKPLPYLSCMFSLAEITLILGKVERATQHPDGTFESDTTHSMMLALMALAVAPSSEVPLDREKLLAFALVHDLVEAYAGDTISIDLNEVDLADKAQRESEALDRIEKELWDIPLIPELIHRYEAQEEPEARFVRYLDKIVPKFTHCLNAGSALDSLGIDVDRATELHTQQGAELRAQYPEFACLHDLFQTAHWTVVSSMNARRSKPCVS